MREQGGTWYLDLPDLTRAVELARARGDVGGFGRWYGTLLPAQRVALAATLLGLADRAGLTDPDYDQALRAAGLAADHPLARQLAEYRRGPHFPALFPADRFLTSLGSIGLRAAFHFFVALFWTAEGRGESPGTAAHRALDLVLDPFDRLRCGRSRNCEQYGGSSTPRLRLVGLKDGSRGPTLFFGTPFEVGRSSQTGLCLAAPGEDSVSRRHAYLTYNEVGWWVADRVSTNGTFLNGNRIGTGLAGPLRVGDVIQFAKAAFEVVLADPRAAGPGMGGPGTEMTPAGPGQRTELLLFERMTESARLAAADPIPQMALLQGDRRCRLFACACVRAGFVCPACHTSGAEAVDGWGEVLNSAERLADPRVPPLEGADRPRRPRAPRPPEWAIGPPTDAEMNEIAVGYDRQLLLAEAFGRHAAEQLSRRYLGHSPRTRAALLGDILGDPARSPSVDPSWLTSEVVAIAEGAFVAYDFGRLPVLADALEDAGCRDAAILDHLREPGPHVRGCWVVDLLTGRTEEPATLPPGVT